LLHRLAKKRNRFLLLALILLSVGSAWADNSEVFRQIRNGMEYFKEVYRILNQHYVDTIQPEELMKAGIEGMLAALDPYTVFIEDEGIDELNQITTGKYGGVGMEIGRREGAIVIITPLPNSPAERAGILAGDIIVGIDSLDLEAINKTSISLLLRGPVGSDVTVFIKRTLVADTLEFNLTRAEIVIEEVPYADFIDKNTAYLRLTGFSANAAASVRTALRDLSRKQPLENLIIDLRGNPGGLLQEAVKIVGLFVPRGEVVVFTEGRKEQQRIYRTESEPLFPTTRLAVLIDEGSASASEIVAGAIQDLDRGIIVGEASFGKGLVQNVFEIANGKARFKITTARYYVPSGRSIQKVEYAEDNDIIIGNGVHAEANFTTRNGRTVVEQGGIQPDYLLSDSSMSFYAAQLWRKGAFFRYAVYFAATKPGLTYPFYPDSAVVDSFYAFVERDSLQIKQRFEQDIARLRKQVAADGDEKLQALLVEAETYLKTRKRAMQARHRDEVFAALLLEINQNLGGNEGRLAMGVFSDPVVKEARRVLTDQQAYRSKLAIR
jgi:carboxyl-terminal processing protease